MNLKLFFTPPSFEFDGPNNAIGHSFKQLQSDDFNISQMNLALVGINTRGDADLIRGKLFNLKRSQANYRMADLGNIQPGDSAQDTQARIREVCEFLISQRVIPILIGGNQDLALGQYKGYEQSKKLISVINVDAFLDMESEGEPSNQFLNDLLTHQPNYLFSYSHLAHQSYLIDANQMKALDKLYFESLRLGELRYDIKQAEPLIRMADMLTFDISAIRSSDAPGNPSAQPFGLSGEEACQLTWYAGINEKMTSVGFHGYHPSLDDDVLKTASVMATMVWYFIDGYYNRKDTGQFNSENYTKYTVSFEGTDDTMTFYKSRLSEKWWMLVNYGENFLDRAYIPCGYKDYVGATHGDFPERWIKAQGKLI
ncbi:formimidoylglutamase [Roseivirga sp.]|uniref:formimidoylglutamase n=1 Tax=Roseivirga sp. TaxID=1964215 RepID=UPI003B8D6FF5